MSTSFRLASRPQASPEIRPFPYAEAAGAEGHSYPNEFSPSVFTAQEKEQCQLAAREAGRKEGEEQARALFQQQGDLLREGLRAALHHFDHERKEYYAKVEAEVVKLALAIAQKILRREVQMDPLVLAGIVRVAMEQLADSTGVVLRVHPVQAAAWREYFARRDKSGILPAITITEDHAFSPDSCVLQTSLGTAEFGITAQLSEIEKGFADLLAQRPK